MQRTASWALLAPLLLVGCTDDGAVGPPTSSTTEPVAPPPVFYGEALCRNVLLFQMVDYSETDPYLPPGFHPRDAQGFLGTAVAFGQGTVLFMMLRCTSETAGPMEVAFLGIFVEAPQVAGVPPAPFNFYELARYGPGGEFGGALQASGWPYEPGNITLSTIPVVGRTFDVDATVFDPEGVSAGIHGTLQATVEVGDGPTRFWHEGPSGLGFIEYGAVLDSQVGAGTCSARDGTPLAVFVGRSIAGTPGCPSFGTESRGDPIIASLNGLALNATFQQLPGASAS